MPNARKLISVVTPTFNEEENVRPLYEAVKQEFAKLPQYDYEHVFIDNASRDRTQEILRAMASEDKRVKVIFNTRNFGAVRSPYYGLLQARGDAVVGIVADFQDPPSLIGEFVKKWEEGYKIVLSVKESSDESPLMYAIRSLYYRFVYRLSEIELIRNATGAGIYDRQVLDILKQIDDPYPYFRGMVADIGFDVACVPYNQPRRRRGITKNNFYSLYDTAMLGITNHSKVPLRIATLAGFVMSVLSLLVALGYLVFKFLFWYWFPAGTVPLLLGVFFFSSVQLFFIGILGEYIGAIHTQVQKRPLVIEKERLNFTPEENGPSDSHP